MWMQLERFPQIHKTHHNNKVQIYFWDSEKLLLLMIVFVCGFFQTCLSEMSTDSDISTSDLLVSALFSGVKSE